MGAQTERMAAAIARAIAASGLFAGVARSPRHRRQEIIGPTVARAVSVGAERLDLPEDVRQTVLLLTLEGSYPAAVFLEHGRATEAAEYLGTLMAWLTGAVARHDAPRLRLAAIDPGLFAYYEVALITARRLDEGRMKRFEEAIAAALPRDVGPAAETLGRLKDALDLSYRELGAMFGVTGETARRWHRGLADIPSDRRAAIEDAGATLDRLLAIFLPERLPIVVRRQSPGFDGRRPLDLILDGRIAEVAGIYERVTRYQAG